VVTDKKLTTIRLGDEDRETIEALQRLTGLDSAAAVIRLALREALGTRRGYTVTKKVYSVKPKRA
jgi:hypothetical protein